MGFALQYYDITVKDLRTEDPITSGCLVFVYEAGTKTLVDIFENSTGINKANPITRANFALEKRITFYSLATSVDVFIADDKGNVALLPGITPEDHTVKLDKTGTEKCLVAPYLFEVGGLEVDTGLDFPQDAWITAAIVEVVVDEAAITLDVGTLSTETSGDPNGIVAAQSTAAAGYFPVILAPGFVTKVGEAKSLSYSPLIASAATEGFIYVYFKIVR